MLKIRAELIREFHGWLPEYCWLPQGYLLKVATSRIACECGGKLRAQWTEIHYPIGILLGRPQLRHKVKQCAQCKKIYRFEEIKEFVPAHGNYCFDIIVEVGLDRFRKRMQNGEIQQDIETRFGLSVPPTTISDLVDRFLDYFGATHYAHSEDIRRYLHAHGGYPLHLDGTCEPGTDTLFAAIDGRSEWVLHASKMRDENEVDIAQLIEGCVEWFGEPLATMRDLSQRIEAAKRKIIPLKPDFICQYHFLLNVGVKLCKTLQGNLRARLRKLKISNSLKEVRHSLIRRCSGGPPMSKEQINELLKDPACIQKLDPAQLPRYLCWLMLRWLDDYQSDLCGEYFPFDLPPLALYHRCTRLYLMLENVLTPVCGKQRELSTMRTIFRHLAPVRNDEELINAAHRLEKAEEIFLKLRQVLRFNPKNNKPLLRQHHTVSTIKGAIKTKERLSKFLSSLRHIVNTSKDKDRIADAERVIAYIEKYWDNLFGHLIYTETGHQHVLISRTNGISERLFGRTKESLRRRVGTKKLARMLQASRPEVLLISNLDHQDYVQIVYGNNLGNMAGEFAKNCQLAKDIRCKRNEKEPTHPIPVTKRQLRHPDFLANVEKAMKMIVDRIAVTDRVA